MGWKRREVRPTMAVAEGGARWEARADQKRAVLVNRALSRVGHASPEHHPCLLFEPPKACPVIL